MDYQELFKDFDYQVVVMNLNSEIIYLNDIAIKKYQDKGGKDLIGKNLKDMHHGGTNKFLFSYVDKLIRENLDEIFMYHDKRIKKDIFLKSIKKDGKVLAYYRKLK